MKKRNILMIGTAVFTGLFFTCCESHEQSADAFDSAKRPDVLEMSPNESGSMAEEVIPVAEKTVPIVIKTVAPVAAVDSWVSFITEIEKKIKLNEHKIEEIKNTPDASSRLLKKVISLEKENNNLNQEIEAYKQEENVRWVTFKAKIYQEANAINLGLKDIVILN
jgi:uncharacterized protein YlzI (FlbEa/FlbD family)